MQSIRKLFVREPLNITGGSLTISYIPSADSTPYAAQFSNAVSLSGTGALSVHTLLVDSTRTFTIACGSLTCNTIALTPGPSLPAKIVLGGNVAIAGLFGATATISSVP